MNNLKEKLCLMAVDDNELSMDMIDLDSGDEFIIDEEGIDTEEEDEDYIEKNKEKNSAEETNSDNTVESPESVSSSSKTTSSLGSESNKDSSPKSEVYRTTAQALKEDGVLPDIEDEFLNTIDSPEKFLEAIDKQVAARLDERQRRINEALEVGVEPTQIKYMEDTISYLNSLNDESIESEGEEGETLRKNLIYQDLINKGFKEDKAKKFVEKSIENATDIDEAKEALESLKESYTVQYNALITESKEKERQAKEAEKAFQTELSNKILNTETPIEGITVDTVTRKKVLENITTPKYKTESGTKLTEIQKYAVDNPQDMAYYFGLFYTITDGFKNLNKIIKPAVIKENNKNIRKIETLVETNQHFGASSNIPEDKNESFDFVDLDAE